MRYIDRNFGKSPFDPDYIEDYDEQEEYDRYLDAVDEKYQARKEGC